MRYRVQFQVTIDVEMQDGREAVPAAMGYLQEAMDWATEHYEGDEIKAVEWRGEILSSVGE